MGLSLLFAAFLGLVQDNPEPRLERAVPRDQLWEVSADFSTWLLHLLEKGRSYQFMDSVKGAIAGLPSPYGGPFTKVRDRALSYYAPPRTLDAVQRRAHVALERIELLRLLGGFEEMVASLEFELAFRSPMWEVLGPERITRETLELHLAWARSALSNSPVFEQYGDSLAQFRWVWLQLVAEPDLKRRASITYDLFKALHTAGDPGAGHALVTRLVKGSAAPVWAKVEALQVRVSAANERSNFVEGERLLGEIVATYKDAPQYPAKLLERASLQVRLQRLPEALRSYETWMRAFVDRAEAPKVQRAIGTIHVVERRWKEALETYVIARDKLRRRSTCGTGAREMFLEDHLRVARCLARLGRRDEALKIIDQWKDGGKFLATAHGIMAVVDAAFGGTREAEFKERIEAALSAPRGHYWDPNGLAYFTVSKAEAAGDAVTLVDVLIKVLPAERPFKEPEWQESLRIQNWVGAEALACLLRMPEKAIPLLRAKAAGGSRTALIALAYCDHADAVALIRNADWIPQELHSLLDPCRKISARWVR